MRLSFSALLLLCAACGSNEFRQCPTTHTDPAKQLYNDVLIEVVEQRLYNAYLPEKDQQALWQNMADGSQGHQELKTRFQRQLFQDTARFQTFYLLTGGATTPHLADLPSRFTALQAGTEIAVTIAALITALAPQQQQAALDSLNAVQRHMQAQEFQLCTARLLPLPTQQGGKEVNSITLSSVVFNARKDRALLTYSWQCGPRCGFGEVLWVEKLNGRWHIRQAEKTWIS